MPLDCGLFCLFTERRRYVEILWRRQLLTTADEKKARRRFRNLMKGFDSEDLEVLKRAILSNGADIKACAPGPPMDEDDEEDELLPGISAVALPPMILPNGAPAVSRTTSIRHVSGAAAGDTAGAVELAHILPSTSRSGQSAGTRRASSIARRASGVSAPRRKTNNNNIRVNNPYQTLVVSDENANGQLTVLQGIGETENGELMNAEGAFDDSGLIPQIDRPMSMPYLCCKMWRWRELQVDAALHRLEPLPWCRFGRVTINNATVSCCNPYHYGLWIRPELTESSEDQSVTGIMANGNGPIADFSTTTDTGYGDEVTTTTIGMPAPHSHSHLHSVSFVKTRRDYAGTNGNGTISLGLGGPSTSATFDDPPSDVPPPVPPYDTTPLVNHVGSGSPPPIHTHAVAWAKLARWERRERIGEVVSLVGKFVALGRLAGTVYDGQDVKLDWDIDNNVSFALIRRMESEFYEDVWLYNSGDKPLFICLSHPHKSENLRRLSSGYCIRVHRIPIDPDSARSNPPTTHLCDPASNLAVLTISVGGGWGINYQRLYVTDMPCRYEVIFS
uniref:Mothers against decapentaplegic homolog n=1 Tax=Panagrellus redivivus TaxID=6233 RepID=A0A7E4ZWZ9_PANRE